MLHLSSLRFKQMVARREKLAPDTVLRKRRSLSAPGEMLGDRTARFTISDNGVDRDKDRVSVLGWNLLEYRSNPIAMWQHGHEVIGGAPIAKVTDIGPDGDTLKAVFEFQPADVPIVGDWAEMVFRSVKSGFLRATSVGFMPDEWVMAKDRMTEDDWLPPIDFVKQTLLEVSIVSVPSNPRALLEEEPIVSEVPFGEPAPLVQEAAPAPAEKAQTPADADAALAELREAERAAVVRLAEKRAHQKRMLAVVGLF